MQAYIKYKAYYDEKANVSKLKETDYVYVLQQKADHQGSKITFTEFRWLGPYIIEKVLPNNNYLVRKIGTNKTQALHWMQMRHFTARHPPVEVRSTTQEYKPDPEVSLKHDDSYARTRECEYEKPVFDAENNNATPPNSTQNPVQPDLSTEERGTHQEPHASVPEELYDVTDTYPYIEPKVETSSEQPNNSPTNPHSSKYNLRHNPKLNCNDDYR